MDGPRAEGPGTTQLLVRETMLQAGGYWRPLAAVARLLEELGELAELLESPQPATDELAAELADLWIITTALADQFLGAVSEPATHGEADTASVRTAGAAIISAGEIARVVNYYDGPKTPRAAAELPSLRKTVPRFHHALGVLAGALGIDLARAVRAKIEVIHGRDMARFAREESDPSTAECLRLLRDSESLTADPALTMSLWGAPRWRDGSTSENAAAIVPSLLSFARAAVAEGLQGYVIAYPSSQDAWEPGLPAELVRSLAARSGARSDGPAGELEIGGLALTARVLSPANGPAEPPNAFMLLERRR